MTDELAAFVEQHFTGNVRLEQWQRHVLNQAVAAPAAVHPGRYQGRTRVDEWVRYALQYWLPAFESRRRARLRRMHMAYSRRRA